MLRDVMRVVAALALTLAALPAFGDEPRSTTSIQVLGCTWYWTDTGTYGRLADVEILVLRDGPATLPVRTGADGCYKFSVPDGRPFQVMFFKEQRVPELQQLAGEKSLRDEAHVTLLTVDQYLRLYGRAPLLSQLQLAITALYRFDGDRAASKIQGQIDGLLRAIKKEQ